MGYRNQREHGRGIMSQSEQENGAQRWDAQAYWRANLITLVRLLVIWFVCSFGFGVLLVDQMNAFTFLGVPLGFWFAQQGAVFTFILLIVAYTLRMRRLDQQFGVDDGDEPDSYDQLPQENPEEGVVS